ncbi:dual specificity protein phosphatase [Bradyrhizobium sp. sGM-13]|uniref:dual specificity protein phosphatase family protein n=1 Tax=Bradyrhizobium sp. sGM-13 TaxID=2831781 RepID=UPI001BCCA766|nr:dual specificity protein phosphatase [Bradyrhizobium sp. sGM-13]
MIEVYPNLFVGNQLDYENHVFSDYAYGPKAGWAVVHACKEPYHRQALGYIGRGAPKDHDEYLFAFRGDRLCLNLVDVPHVQYVNPAVIDAALSFIASNLAGGKKVLVHCNQGQSRAPSIALLYLGKVDPQFARLKAADAIHTFQWTYPQYEPADGIAEYVLRNWPNQKAA